VALSIAYQSVCAEKGDQNSHCDSYCAICARVAINQNAPPARDMLGRKAQSCREMLFETAWVLLTFGNWKL